MAAEPATAVRHGGKIDPDALDDRRRAPRQPAFKTATADSPDGRRAVCIARNISERGCKLIVSVDDDLPDCFALRLDGEGAARPAQVIWREHGALGVRFLR